MAENTNDHQDLDEARAALERLEAQLRELDELSKEMDAFDAEPSLPIAQATTAPSALNVPSARPDPVPAPAVEAAVEPAAPPAPAPKAKPASAPKPAPVAKQAPAPKPAPAVTPAPTKQPIPAPRPVAPVDPIPAPVVDLPTAVSPATTPTTIPAAIAPAVSIPSLSPPPPAQPPQPPQPPQPSQPPQPPQPPQPSQSGARIRPDSVSRPISIRKPLPQDLGDPDFSSELEDERDVQPSVFREVRGSKEKPKGGARRGVWPWLLALSLLAAIGVGLVYSVKQGLFDLSWNSAATGETEDPYIPAAISLDPLPGDQIGAAGPDAAPDGEIDPLMGAIDFALEPDFIRFKQLVKLGDAVVVFQTWRLGKLTREGEAVNGNEYVILDLRVRNDTKKNIRLRPLFQETVMLDGQERRLPNLILERDVLQDDLPEYVKPGSSELVRFVFQARAGSGDFHLRLPGNPPRQLDLAALPAPGLAPGVVDTLFR